MMLDDLFVLILTYASEGWVEGADCPNADCFYRYLLDSPLFLINFLDFLSAINAPVAPFLRFHISS